MPEVTFSAHQLILDENRCSFEDLKDFFSKGDDTYTDTENFYQISREIIDDRFLWLYAAYGKAFPRTDQVIETTTFLPQANPRKPTQVEPDKQFFVIYDCESKVLHVSNRLKTGFCQSYLKSQTGQDFFIKNFYVNVDEFAAKIKTISSVKLVTSNNLFSAATKLFEEEKNVFGLGVPANFDLEAEFSNASITDGFVRKLKEVLNWKNQGQVDSLVCIGQDDRGMEAIFNVDAFIEQITLVLKKDTQGLFVADEVKDALIIKIKAR